MWFVPGTPVGAGGAFTSGLKELPPVGPMRFSVGVTSAVDEGVVVVLDGFSVSPPPQAVNTAIDTMAAKPSAAATPRYRGFCILKSDLSRGSGEPTVCSTVLYSTVDAFAWFGARVYCVQVLLERVTLVRNYTRYHQSRRTYCSAWYIRAALQG